MRDAFHGIRSRLARWGSQADQTKAAAIKFVEGGSDSSLKLSASPGSLGVHAAASSRKAAPRDLKIAIFARSCLRSCVKRREQAQPAAVSVLLGCANLCKCLWDGCYVGQSGSLYQTTPVGPDYLDSAVV